MKKAFQLFQADPEKVLQMQNLTDADFEKAADSEKEKMVQMHKSVSYWQDAWRRFRRNHVSMGSLFVFILILLFSFIGPMFIEYSYEEQYRSAQKLGPMEYSETEQMVQTLMKNGADGFYATSLGDPQVYIAKDKDWEDGAFKEVTPVEITDTPAEDAQVIELSTKVFPHVFGTDSQGRDLMARCMYGSRVSIIIGVVAALIVLVIGALYGSISGFAGGKVDFVMMRIVDLIYSIPDVLIVLLLQVVLKEPLQNWFDSSRLGVVNALSTLGVGIVSIFITFGLLYWVGMARIIRGQVLQLKEQEYVMAATVLGASSSRIIRRHLLPNCVGQLIIQTCLQIPSAIFLESFLSYLGLGVSAPMASLGSLCSDAKETFLLFPYRLLFPAILLSLIVLTLNLIGDGLRDALDPRLKN